MDLPAGALGLTLGNAIELTWDERVDWVRIILVGVTALAVSFLRMPLLLVLVIFGGSRSRPRIRAFAEEVRRG